MAISRYILRRLSPVFRRTHNAYKKVGLASLGSQLEVDAWRRRGFAPPATQSIKWKTIQRFAGSSPVWVETGTYKGETTELFSSWGARVWTIEPLESLATRAEMRFSSNSKVTVFHGTSESTLALILETIGDGPAAFWLDGHFSGEGTYQGQLDTPLVSELTELSSKIRSLGPVCVCIDDFRCFEPWNDSFKDYPDRNFLVEWSTREGFRWTIENDIFIAWSSDWAGWGTLS